MVLRNFPAKKRLLQGTPIFIFIIMESRKALKMLSYLADDLIYHQLLIETHSGLFPAVLAQPTISYTC